VECAVSGLRLYTTIIQTGSQHDMTIHYMPVRFMSRQCNVWRKIKSAKWFEKKKAPTNTKVNASEFSL